MLGLLYTGASNTEVLDAHNLYRCMHGAPPMTWDTRVEAKAREWAQRGKFDHSPNSFRTINGVYRARFLTGGGYRLLASAN